jgi:hypothetical protein
MCIDSLWVSVVIFLYNKEMKITLLTYRGIVNSIVKDISRGEIKERIRSTRALLE